MTERIRGALRAIFGELHWRAPAWMTGVAAGVRRTSGALRRAAAANPRGALVAAVGLLALLFGAALLWRAYEARPKPVLVQFTVSAPPATCYGCEPPGAPNPLIVQFDGPAAPLEHTGRPMSAEEIGASLRPAQAGRWTWEDDRTLRFQPAQDWPIGERYVVTFAKRGFAAPATRLAARQFEFESAPFVATLGEMQFHQNPVMANDKKVVAAVAFSHPVDPVSFEQRVRLRLFERVNDATENELPPPSHTVVYDKLKLHAYVHSSQLASPAKGGRVEIAVASNVRAARGGPGAQRPLTASVDVPGLNSLRIADLSLDIVRDERNEPDQVLLINTSFSVSERDLPGKVHAWLLPLRHPDPRMQQPSDNRNPAEPFAWDMSNFRPEVLTEEARLELTQVPGEREHYELHSLRYRADPGRYLYVRIDAGLKSFGGYLMPEVVERIVRVPEFPRELSILHRGSLLAMSGDKTLTLFSRNVPAMRIEVGRLLPGQLQHLVSQTHGEFATPSFSHWALDAANLTERFSKIVRLPPAPAGKAQYEALDLGEYLHEDGADRRGVFLLRVQGWNADQDRPLDYARDQWNAARQGQAADARVLVVTDLGLLAKRSIDGSRQVFVQSIASGAPLAGVTVEVIGRNGLPVLSETSDVDGRVHFPDLQSFQREQQPVLYLARRGGDASFLPIEERDRSLDLSRFDVGGVMSSADRGALAAYIFSDRGLYRPGEQIRAGAIVRSQDWKQSLAGTPLRLEITDPRGVVVRRETYAPGVAGFGEILHPTMETSPTGVWTLSLSVVRDRHRADLIGSTTVQVRDFLPDRLRMQTRFSAQSDGWVSPDELRAHVQLDNLFGAAAENRRVTAQMTLSPSIPEFRAFPDYRFHDPQYAPEGFTEPLPDATTDAQGQASFELNLQRFARATYRVHLVTQGFEADGGRGVTSEAAQLVSSMPYLIGYKVDGDLEYLRRDSERRAHLIAIDPQVQRTTVDQLRLIRMETRHVSVLMRQPNGTYKYESRRKQIPLSERPLSIPEAGYALILDTSAPGAYSYVVRDMQGQQLAAFDYRVAGDGAVTRGLEKNAELELTLSKRDYRPGEEVELSIRAPYAGSGLITIERERVYAWRWFTAESASSVQRIRLPEELEGSAYVSVAFVRDPASSEIYTSPLSYGVQPFSIDVNARRNIVTVESPERIKPGEKLTLRYRTERPSRIVLFAVDEGVLQAASYRTPDPLGHFFQKRALEVTTTQILDLILPEFRRLNLASAPGGDAAALLGKRLNPFRRKGEATVAFWSGVLDADSTFREVSYVAPDYFNGRLAITAVAVSDERIGVHQGGVLVRGDFVLSPNAPTTATPGDEFEVSVGVSNNVANSGADASIQVAVATQTGLEVVGEANRRVAVAEGREGVVRFRLRARDEPGPVDLTFTATLGEASATRRVDMSIRPATPYMTTLQAGVLRRGERDVRVARAMYPHHRRLEVGVSTLPMQFAHGFASYLASYPYSCTEQIVSQAMPAVLLSTRPEFGAVRSAPGADLGSLIGELRTRQNDAGAYRLWAGGDQVVAFVSLYAHHLLLEAGERGLSVPADLIEDGARHVRSIAQRDGDNLEQERESAYAMYLLARQGVRVSAEVAAARRRLEQRYQG
ncbi:MAG TPA: alpha-2-macroglobulin, partial [Steroidobacter sp.]|nr:alpha-2-macroglobulin [Steroidobacter sp.]